MRVSLGRLSLYRTLPSGPSVQWRFLIVVLMAKCSWDCVGMACGDYAFAGPAYDVLRTLPPGDGMRIRGILLAALTVGTYWAARRAVAAGQSWPLRLCLTGIAVWYAMWAAGLFAAWMVHGRILGWSAPASVLVVAVFALAAARATPQQVGGG